MHVFQSFSHLLYVTDSLRFVQRSLFLHYFLQGFSVNVIHYIISRAIFLEHVSYTHDVRMLHGKQGTCFFYKLLFQSFYQFHLALCSYGNVTGILITVAEVLYKELLNGNPLMKQNQLRFVRTSESST